MELAIFGVIVLFTFSLIEDVQIRNLRKQTEKDEARMEKHGAQIEQLERAITNLQSLLDITTYPRPIGIGGQS